MHYFLSTLCAISWSLMPLSANASSPDSALVSAAMRACDCIDLIPINTAQQAEINGQVTQCISSSIVQQHSTATNRIDSLQYKQEYMSQYLGIEQLLYEYCTALEFKVQIGAAIFPHALSKHPKAMDHFNEGIQALQEGAYTSAIKDFQAALKLDNKCILAWNYLGTAYRRSGMLHEALAAYKQSLQQYPQGMQALQNAAAIYIAQKSYTAAVACYENMIAIDAKNPEPHLGIGYIYTHYDYQDEKALHAVCTAYNIYQQASSPYTAEASELLTELYRKMKLSGRASIFSQILHQYKIKFE